MSTHTDRFLGKSDQGNVSNPDKVKVERKVDEMGVLLTLSVDPMDMGLIIGEKDQRRKPFDLFENRRRQEQCQSQSQD